MATFATITDLAIRMGRVTEDDFTDAQAAQGELLLDLATGLIADAVDRDQDWADDLDPVPPILRAVCLEMCARVMTNPSGVRSEAETLGQHQHSVSFTDGQHLLYLTDAEARLCRRVAVGATSGSAALESLATTLAANWPATLDGLMEASTDDPPVYDWTD